MDQITEQQAVALYDSGAWRDMTDRDRARFQIVQDRLCMPFDEFHGAVERTIGRPVFTHEFGLNRDGLVAEILDGADPPSFAEVLAQLSAAIGPDSVMVAVAIPTDAADAADAAN